MLLFPARNIFSQWEKSKGKRGVEKEGLLARENNVLSSGNALLNGYFF